MILFFQTTSFNAQKILYKHGHKHIIASVKPNNIELEKVEEEPDIVEEPEPEINIIFAGDTMFDWGLRPILDKHGYDYPFTHVKKKVQAADYAFINAETVFTKRAEKDPNQLFWIKSEVQGLDALKNAGFDMLNIGNNHTLDYLRPGLLDTLQHVESYDFDYIGAGRNAKDAYAAKEVIIKGKKFKFFSFVRFIPSTDWLAVEGKSGVPNGYDLPLVKKTIQEQQGDADYTIVYFHWGVEKQNKPVDYQRQYAQELQQIGVDLIVGSHPHWLQGFEIFDGMPVAYSLGNFLFPPYVKDETAQTGLLTAKFHGNNITLSFDPHIIDNGKIKPLSEKAYNNMLKYLESISFNIRITETGEIHPKQ